jgi:hypothetical protein
MGIDNSSLQLTLIITSLAMNFPCKLSASASVAMETLRFSVLAVCRKRSPAIEHPGGGNGREEPGSDQGCLAPVLA